MGQILFFFLLEALSGERLSIHSNGYSFTGRVGVCPWAALNKECPLNTGSLPCIERKINLTLHDDQKRHFPPIPISADHITSLAGILANSHQGVQYTTINGKETFIELLQAFTADR